MGTVNVVVQQCSGGTNLAAGVPAQEHVLVGFTAPVNYVANVTAQLAISLPDFSEDSEDSGGSGSEEDESVEVGIVQCVTDVRREFSYSSGDTNELYSTAPLPCRDGDGNDDLFVTLPGSDSVLDLGGFAIDGTISIPDFPQSRIAFRQPNSTAASYLEQVVIQDAFRSGVAARWPDGSVDLHHWFEWETDILCYVSRSAVNTITRVQIVKGSVNVTGGGVGHKTFGALGTFINDSVELRKKLRSGIKLSGPNFAKRSSGCHGL